MKDNTENIKLIKGTAEAWESGKLGRDEKYAEVDQEATEEINGDLNQLAQKGLLKD